MRALLLALVLLAAPIALAKHTPQGRCTSEQLPSLGIVRIGERGSPRTFYLDDRNYFENGVWLYEETNGIDDGTAEHGVQRGGGSFLIASDGAGAQSDPDICTDDPFVSPDQLWF